jgi:hypothetical protein
MVALNFYKSIYDYDNSCLGGTSSSSTFTIRYYDVDIHDNKPLEIQDDNIIKRYSYLTKSKRAVFGWCYSKLLKEYTYRLLYWVYNKKYLCKIYKTHISLKQYFSGFVLDGRGRHFNYKQNNSRWY